MPVLFLFLLPHRLCSFPSAAFPSPVFRLLVFPSKTSFTKEKKEGGGFPCGLVFRIWAFTAMALGSILDRGTVSPAVWCGQKKKP